MNLNIGDKVKFLNASGGGIVVRIIDSRMVSVMGEDGFDIPTLISELIKTGSQEPAARFFDSHYNIKIPDNKATEAEDDDRMSELPAELTKERKTEDLLLAFVPHDQKWLITGLMDIFLINNTSFDVLYNIFLQTHTGHYEGTDYGSLFPDSKLLVNTVNREQLGHWSTGSIQFLFHRQQVKSVLPPFNSEFTVEARKFFKEGSYRFQSILQAKALVIKVLSLSDHFGRGEVADEAPGGIPAAPGKDHDELIRRYQVYPGEAVVDLHIHELLDDPSNLDSTDILSFQQSFFQRCLNSAIACGFRKVIFIHGIGNGVLRNAVKDIIAQHGGLEYSDAPMSRYGAGAIEVRFPQPT